MNLPTVILKLRVRNPDGDKPYYVERDIECEVLTVHIERQTMRVRYNWLGSVETTDVSAEPFFARYALQPTFPWLEKVDPSERERPGVVHLRREDTGEIYGMGCMRCGGFWKIYQQTHHNPGCSYGTSNA